MSSCFWSEYHEAAVQTLHLGVVRMAEEERVSGQVGMTCSSSL